MGTSYTGYNGYGFWAHDQFLSGTLYLIQREIKKTNLNTGFLKQINENLFIAATDENIGSIPNHISDFDTDEKVDYLKFALSNIINKIAEDSFISVDELNINAVGGYAWTHIPKEEFLRVVKLLYKLVNGELKTNASSKIDYLQ